MDASARIRRSRRRRCGGQAIIETVGAIMLLCLILFAMLQVALLYMAQMIADHTANVTARSYVVGFDDNVVQRAREVGSIPMSGHIQQPVAYQNLSPVQLGAIEPDLIEDFLSTGGYTLWYEHWGRIREEIPMLGAEGMTTVRIRVRNYPLQMPMHRAYIRSDSIDFESAARLYNHAGYYLE